VIRAIWGYLRDEVLPRWQAVIFGSELWLAIVIGITCGIWGDDLALAHAKVGDITSAVLTYAAIAFGFCLSGLSLVLALPDREFATRLARSSPTGSRASHYSELIFVFSWTAIIHWLDVAGSIALFVFCGSEERVFPPCDYARSKVNLLDFVHREWFWIDRRLVVFAATFLTVYAVFQFLITLITLAQVGRVYIDSLKASA